MRGQRTNRLQAVLLGRGRIPPSQTIANHMDYPANPTPVVGMPSVCGKKGSLALAER
jgi:hypothetical protein